MSCRFTGHRAPSVLDSRSGARSPRPRQRTARRDRRGARPCARSRRAPRERARGTTPGRGNGAERGAPRRCIDRRRGRRGDGRRDRVARSGRRVRVGPRRSRASRDPRRASGVPDETAGRFGVYPLEARWARLGGHDRSPARRRRVGRGLRRPLSRAGGGSAPDRRRVARRASAADRARRRDRRDLRRRDPSTLGHLGTARPAARDRGADRGARSIAHPSRPTPSASRRRTPSSRSSASRWSGRRPRAVARRRLVDALVDERATFAAVHLVTESDEVEEIASAGSLPEELADEDRALRWIGEVISTGRAAGADELDPSLVRRLGTVLRPRPAAAGAREDPRRADHQDRRGHRLEARDQPFRRPGDR